ncbi:hypothetical protein GCM10011416_15840 [Polaribacter pacificus]|uniref:Aminopeptidase N n=1 Tax=Polaribacter pacificus TaxID=1775173 RepID=A0A917HYR7_9FLAO|nr:M1 family metallopeptidase [Polaribacter pacificus]GGG98521.1 hypothetical protein GCM10011416_15840 [Polaribacter pacificus]
MKFKIGFFLLAFCFVTTLFAQKQSDVYQAEKTKTHAIIHTKLKVDFNFEKKQLNGEEWITLQPYFYATDQVVLDAKAMIINQITLGSASLDYYYDGKEIRIELPRKYTRNEKFTLYIKYIARPEEVKQKGSNAIKQAKGLYFINADGLDKNKPTQIWTQGETEASSCWFPTIDSPNQKTSQEIYITVPNRFKTLSNGVLVSQTTQGDLRTDYWKFNQKHAPYLFFMGVGEYEVVQDRYKNIPVNYYVEKEFAPYAKDIFGKTPKMMAFFSKITGIDYPWSSYSQIVARDYVSGAMENTTAVIHGEQANQMPGQLIDENLQENTIAHELFHHWFGNLVTAESWSNLTVNESFANYAEYLWREHEYGLVNADAHLVEDREAYFQGDNFDKELVRYYYTDKEDLFDAVSYNKGGSILHMLRNYLGDEAFYTGLNHYLTTNAYKSAEAHQLRLSFEAVTGKDLNWFFNQWYFGSGHPRIKVSYDYNTLEKRVTVNIRQIDEVFQFPLSIDIIEDGKRKTHQVFVSKGDASFNYVYDKVPELILVNADGVLLADFIETKTLKNYINQFKYARFYGDKKEALLAISKKQEEKEAFKLVAEALKDPFYKIRVLALQNIDLINKNAKGDVIDKITSLATSDPSTLVQAAAIETLGKLTDPVYMQIFNTALKSKSFSVLGNALVSTYYLDKDRAVKISKSLPDEVRKIIATPLTRIYIEEKDDSELDFIAKNVLAGMFLNTNTRVQSLYKQAYEKIAKSNNSKAIANLVDDMVVKGKQYQSFGFDTVVINLMRQMVDFQKEGNYPNAIKNIELIRAGLGRLLQ